MQGKKREGGEVKKNDETKKTLQEELMEIFV